MDISQSSIKYLNSLYCKSKDDFDAGYSGDLISKLCGFDKAQGRNVKNYLLDKGLIAGSGLVADKFKLTGIGIDYVMKLRENKIFKTIKFKGVRHLPSSIDAIEFLYYYDLIDEEGTSESKTIKVSISGSLSIGWGFHVLTPHPDKDYTMLKKMLLQVGKDKIIEKLKEDTLTESEELMLLTTTHPNSSPYNPEALIEVENAEYEIEIGQKILSEVIKENKLAAAIIETRDRINAVFYLRNKVKLILLNEERNLLDFFKSAETEEELTHRLASLGQVSRNLNIAVLRKLTNETNTKLGSIALLEKFLQNVGKPNKTITDHLKHIGRVRQGYPIHTDIAGVIPSYRYFGLQYPVENYETTWTILLNYYLESLKLLYEILVDLYLTEEK